MAAVEMCNGAAVCRKLKAGTMCPSYMATKDENDTTRARANALRNALAGNIFEPADLTSKETYEVMDLCLSCKACKTECPSSVDMAKLKTEFLAQYYDANGTPTACQAVRQDPHAVASRFDLCAGCESGADDAAGRAGDARGGRASRAQDVDLQTQQLREALEKARARSCRRTGRHRGAVVYFHDTFATYNYPRIGMAAVELLEAAGFQVIIEERRACCGRPMLSKGLVAEARKSARRNVELLAPHARLGIPDHRHRAELHSDPAGRVHRPACRATTMRSWSRSTRS